MEGAVEYGRQQEEYKGAGFIGIDAAHRDKDSQRRFFEWRGKQRTAAIEGVCCDIWRNYIDVIHEYCGEAVIVFDKFHTVRHRMEAIDEVRKMEAKTLADAGCETLKGTKYIWLKNPRNLKENEGIRLSDLLRS